jgi:hypothetical protein
MIRHQIEEGFVLNSNAAQNIDFTLGSCHVDAFTIRKAKSAFVGIGFHLVARAIHRWYRWPRRYRRRGYGRPPCESVGPIQP